MLRAGKRTEHASTNADQWSSLVLRVPLVIATSEFGQEAKLADPFDNWPAWGSDMILRPGKWKTMLARARIENWWDDPSDDLDEDALECGNFDRSGVPVHSLPNRAPVPSAAKSSRKDQKQSRRTGCERMDIANQCHTASRATALSALGATSTSRTGQSYLTMHSTEAKAAATRSCCRSQTKLPSLLVRRTHIFA